MPKSRCQQSHVPSEGSREVCAPGFDLASGSSSVCSSVTPILHGMLPVCAHVCLDSPSYKRPEWRELFHILACFLLYFFFDPVKVGNRFWS